MHGSLGCRSRRRSAIKPGLQNLEREVTQKPGLKGEKEKIVAAKKGIEEFALPCWCKTARS